MSTEIVVGTVAGIVVVGVIALFIFSYLKGSVKLSLENTSASRGESIKGSLALNAKKAIEGNGLSVWLIAHEKTDTRDSEGEKRTRSREIYRDTVNLESSKDYPAGFSDEYAFEFKIPDSSEEDISESSSLDQAAQFIGKLINNERKYIEWSIKARLDAKGIDLQTSRQVFVDIAESN